MDNKHIKRCSPSLIIQEMQIKTAMKYHLAHVRMATIKKHKSNDDVEKLEPMCINSENVKWCSYYGKVWWFLKNLKLELAYDPAISLLGIYPAHKAGTPRGICTPMLIAPLFAIAQRWKQLQCSSLDEWINKMWYMYTMTYHSALKRKEF